MRRVLICEDEENIVSFIKAELEYEDIEADTAGDGISAMELFKGSRYDLVLLDIMLPRKNGLECLREIRKTSAVPVIILTARKDVYDKVAFLNAGADDYITKPFDTLELIARIKRNIARGGEVSASGGEGADAAKGLTVLKDEYRAYINRKPLHLTKTEFEILSFLYENKNKALTRDEIISAVFGEFYGESNVVDVNIKNIRGKLRKHEPDEVIFTVRGKGYVIRG